MVKRIILVSIICCSHISPLWAQTVTTWEDCLREAVQHHPDLAAARESIIQSKANKDIVQSDLFPQIDADLNASTDKEGDKNYNYGASGSQLIFDGFKTVNNVREAKFDLTATEYAYLVSSSNIRLQLRSAFIDLLREQEFLRIHEGIEQRRNDSLELVKLRYEAGREHKGALLAAEANLARAQDDVRATKLNIDVAQRRLNTEMGREQFTPIQVTGPFEVTDPVSQQPVFETLAESTPFLRELTARKEAAKHGAASAKGDFFPAIFASGDIGRSQDRWPPGNESWDAGVRVDLPIFDGGSRGASLRRARSQLRESQAQERSGRHGVILTLHETWADLQDALHNVRVEQKFLESAEARSKIGQGQYANGLVSFDDWIIIENALVIAQKSFLEARAQALFAEAGWVQAKGGTFENEHEEME